MPNSLIDAERLSLKDAARRLGVSLPTVWRWCLHGVSGRKLASLQIGGRRYVLLADLERFLQAGCDPESRQRIAEADFEAEARELDRELKT